VHIELIYNSWENPGAGGNHCQFISGKTGNTQIFVYNV